MSGHVERFTPRPPEALNDPREEFLHCCLDGKPASARKRLIVMAALPGVNFISHEQAETLLDAYGLKEA